MTEYQLQILRTESVLPSKQAAILLLDTYEHHKIGQPVSVLYKDGQDTRVLYAIGKKDPDTLPVGEPKCGSDFYDIISNDSSASSDCVLAKDIISNYPTNVGYIEPGDKLEKGTSITSVIEKILNGEIYPDKLETYIPVASSISITGSPSATITLTIVDANGKTIGSGSTVEAGTTLKLKAITLVTSGTKDGEVAGTVTVKNTDSSNLTWGYKVNNLGDIKKTTYTQPLYAYQNTSAKLSTNSKTGGCISLIIDTTGASEQSFVVGSGSSSIQLKTTAASGTAKVKAGASLYYVSNNGNTSDSHRFDVLSTTSSNYGGSTRTYSWSCAGDYPVLYYTGTSNPTTLGRDSWVNNGWLNGTLFTEGVSVPQGSYFAIAIPKSWKLNDVDSGMAGISVVGSFKTATAAFKAKDDSEYTVHYIQATATGNTKYLNVKISR